MILTILMFGMGEWIEANPAVTAMIVIQVLGGFGVIYWLRFAVQRLISDVEEVKKEVASHLQDKDAHVNQLYIGTLKDRIDKLEQTVASGHKEISAKIDSKFDQIVARMK